MPVRSPRDISVLQSRGQCRGQQVPFTLVAEPYGAYAKASMSLDHEPGGDDDAWSEALRRRSEAGSTATAETPLPESWGSFHGNEAFSTEQAAAETNLQQENVAVSAADIDS